jgi:hypothetical protein
VLVVVVVDSLIVEVAVLAVVVVAVEAQLVQMVQLLVMVELVAVVAVLLTTTKLGIVIQRMVAVVLLLLLTQDHRDFQAVVFQQCQDRVIQSIRLPQAEH